MECLPKGLAKCKGRIYCLLACLLPCLLACSLLIQTQKIEKFSEKMEKQSPKNMSPRKHRVSVMNQQFEASFLDLDGLDGLVCLKIIDAVSQPFLSGFWRSPEVHHFQTVKRPKEFGFERLANQFTNTLSRPRAEPLTCVTVRSHKTWFKWQKHRGAQKSETRLISNQEPWTSVPSKKGPLKMKILQNCCRAALHGFCFCLKVHAIVHKLLGGTHILSSHQLKCWWGKLICTATRDGFKRFRVPEWEVQRILQRIQSRELEGALGDTIFDVSACLRYISVSVCGISVQGCVGD